MIIWDTSGLYTFTNNKKLIITWDMLNLKHTENKYFIAGFNEGSICVCKNISKKDGLVTSGELKLKRIFMAFILYYFNK